MHSFVTGKNIKWRRLMNTFIRHKAEETDRQAGIQTNKQWQQNQNQTMQKKWL